MKIIYQHRCTDHIKFEKYTKLYIDYKLQKIINYNYKYMYEKGIIK